MVVGGGPGGEFVFPPRGPPPNTTLGLESSRRRAGPEAAAGVRGPLLEYPTRTDPSPRPPPPVLRREPAFVVRAVVP